MHETSYKQKPTPEAAPDPHPETQGESEAGRELSPLEKLVERAMAGDASVLPELREALADHPAVWEHYGNLGLHAENAWIQKIAGQNLCLAEGLRERLKPLREELVGKEPTFLEELLVRRVSLSFLQMEYYELALATLPPEAPAMHLKFLEQHRDAAHKRHLQALKSFTETQKLLAESPHIIPLPSRKPNPPRQRKPAI